MKQWLNRSNHTKIELVDKMISQLEALKQPIHLLHFWHSIIAQDEVGLQFSGHVSRGLTVTSFYKEPAENCGKRLKSNNLTPEYSLIPALHHAARSNCGGKVIKRSSGRKNRRKSPPYLSIKSIKNAGKKML